MLHVIGEASAVEEEAALAAVATTDEPSPEAEPQSSPDAGVGDTPEAQPPATEIQPEQPAPGAAPAAEEPASPSGGTPTDIRTPFAFRVDRTEVQVPGAFVDAEGFVRIPKEQWERTVHPRLADKGAIQREFQRRDQRISQLSALADPERNADVQAAKALSEAISTRLLADGLTDDEILDEVARIRGEIPVLTERAKAQALQARLGDFEAGRSEQEAVEALHQSVPVLGQGITAYVQSAIQHPDVAAAALDANELLAELWGNGELDDLAEIFEDVDEGGSFDPNRVIRTPGGLVAIRPNVDRMILAAAKAAIRTKQTADATLAQERQSFQAREEAAKRSREAAEANRKALAPRPGAPPVVGAQGSPSGVSEEKPWNRLQREAREARDRGERGKYEELMADAKHAFDKWAESST